jgi:hypothetical protein
MILLCRATQCCIRDGLARGAFRMVNMISPIANIGNNIKLDIFQTSVCSMNIASRWVRHDPVWRSFIVARRPFRDWHAAQRKLEPCSRSWSAESFQPGCLGIARSAKPAPVAIPTLKHVETYIRYSIMSAYLKLRIQSVLLWEQRLGISEKFVCAQRTTPLRCCIRHMLVYSILHRNQSRCELSIKEFHHLQQARFNLCTDY